MKEFIGEASASTRNGTRTNAMAAPASGKARRGAGLRPWALGLLAAFVGMLPRGAEAQEIQLTGPLKGAPAVRQLRLYREGRIEIAPTVSFTLLDEYRRTIFAGGRAQYNIKDWLGIGVWGGAGVASIAADLTEQINQRAPRNEQTKLNVSPNTKDGFQSQTAQLKWIAAPQVQLVPFRGKLAIFQKIFVDTDAYLHGGAAFVGISERANCGGSSGVNCGDAKSFNMTSRTAIAPTFGLGLNFYLSDLLSLGVEYRAFPFAWNRAGFDSRGKGTDGRFPDLKVDSQDQTFRFNQMISISLGIFPQKRQTSE